MAFPKHRVGFINELLKRAQEMDESDLVTVKEFKEFVKLVTNYVLKMEERFNGVISGHGETLKKDVLNLKKLSEDVFSTHSKEVSQSLSRALKQMEKVAKSKDGDAGYTPQKGIDYFDGVSPDPENLIAEVLKRFKPQGLTEEEKGTIEWVIEAIKKLKEQLDEAETRIVPMSSVGGRGLIKEVDISGQLDGTTKTFSIGAFYRVLSVDLSSFPHALRKTTDYTYDGNAGTVTFTSQIDAESSLATGQTCIITLVLN